MTAPVAEATPSSRTLPRYVPTVLWILAAILLLASLPFPYWKMTLLAPQYPDGLSIRIFANRITGDDDPTLDEVAEIDGLNHYIGMRSMYEAAQFEQSIALPSVGIFVLFLIIAALWRKKWIWLLTLPALSFPFVYLADVGLWMRAYGQNLDPSAPLSSAIKPFTPPVIGEGVVGQFRTIAFVDLGWFIAVAGSLCIMAAIIIHWRQFKQESTADA